MGHAATSCITLAEDTSLAKQFVGNEWVQISVIMLGVVSFAASVYFYLKSRRFKRPVFQTSSATLSVPSLTDKSKLRILWDNAPVEQVTVTQLCVWNAGNADIGPGDIVDGSLTVALTTDSKVLAAKLIARSGPSIKAELTTHDDRQALTLKLPFLQARHGVLAEIVHSGNRRSDLTVSGTILNAMPIESWRSPKLFPGQEMFAAVIPMMCLGVIAVWLSNASDWNQTKNLTAFALGCTGCTVWFVMHRLFLRARERQGPPETLFIKHNENGRMAPIEEAQSLANAPPKGQ